MPAFPLLTRQEVQSVIAYIKNFREGGWQPPKPIQASPEPVQISGETGEQLFVTAGCIACRKFDPLKAPGGVGPDLSNIGNRLSVEKIARSITAPNAEIAQNCPAGPCPLNVMPQNYAERLSASQIQTLTTLFVSLQVAMSASGYLIGTRAIIIVSPTRPTRLAQPIVAALARAVSCEVGPLRTHSLKPEQPIVDIERKPMGIPRLASDASAMANAGKSRDDIAFRDRALHIHRSFLFDPCDIPSYNCWLSSRIMIDAPLTTVAPRLFFHVPVAEGDSLAINDLSLHSRHPRMLHGPVGGTRLERGFHLHSHSGPRYGTPARTLWAHCRLSFGTTENQSAIHPGEILRCFSASL
jgi:hypothetical protein